MNQSELAKLANVSRQAVSQWFKSKDADVDIGSTRLRDLAQGLGVSADALLLPPPLLAEKAQTRRLETALLWDHLYPSLIDFSLALANKELAATARLVEVEGLYRASQIMNDKFVWNRFEDYKKRIRPLRRQQLEAVWNVHQSLA